MKLPQVKKLAGLALAGAVVVTTPLSALAQDELTEARVRKIEAETVSYTHLTLPTIA